MCRIEVESEVEPSCWSSLKRKAMAAIMQNTTHVLQPLCGWFVSACALTTLQQQSFRTAALVTQVFCI